MKKTSTLLIVFAVMASASFGQTQKKSSSEKKVIAVQKKTAVPVKSDKAPLTDQELQQINDAKLKAELSKNKGSK